jgi:neutral ceramidase
MSILRRLAVALGILALAGCGGSAPFPPADAPLVEVQRPELGQSRLRVGAERADVTPPPGVSLFGHGPEGRVADGYWSRLYCRAFAFVLDVGPGQPAPTPLVVVPCDLGAISMLLQRSVADKAGIPASRLMMTATHTHAGPAHYFEGEFYGGALSTREPGFDPKMVAFLSDEIAGAVVRAIKNAHPARLAWSHSFLWGLTRNRSLKPFEQNDPPYVPGAECGAGSPPAGALPDERAINPCLDVLWIDEVDAEGDVVGPIGSISFFAMHPTVLPNTNRLLNADADGVASREVERRMRVKWKTERPECAVSRDPLHAVVNTSEGDMSPQWTTPTSDEAIRIGNRLASAIWQSHDWAIASPAIVDARYVEVHLPGATFFGEPQRGTSASIRRLCSEPLLGMGAPKGASDHPTDLSLVGDFRDENVDLCGCADPCSAPKRPALGWVQKLIGGIEIGFPEDVPLAVARLGGTVISFVPAELTVTAGARLSQTVLDRVRDDLHADRSLVAGLANGYFEYVTTEEEYRLQHYEGSSDLYGIWTARWLQQRYDILAFALAGHEVTPWFGDHVDRVMPTEYRHASVRDRLPSSHGAGPVVSNGNETSQGLCRLGQDPLSVCFWWQDAAPGIVPPPPRRDVPPGRPRFWLRLERFEGGAVHDESDPDGDVDDRGLAFRTRVNGPTHGGYRWHTVLTPGYPDWRSFAGDSKVRIAVRSSDDRAILSDWFSSSKPPAPCDLRHAVLCDAGD